mmetsp:Transcript_24648/g.81946  ORF Transcript_24648/g.81946 Transcript_24648/m.81946 type:complete len:227 (+) Transcript_24648:825-1505(+)
MRCAPGGLAVVAADRAVRAVVHHLLEARAAPPVVEARRPPDPAIKALRTERVRLAIDRRLLHRRTLALRPSKAVMPHSVAVGRLAREGLAASASLRRAHCTLHTRRVEPEERAAPPGAAAACEAKGAGPVDGLAELKPHARAVRDIVEDSKPVVLARLRRLPPHNLRPPPAGPLDNARRLRLRPAEEPEVVVHVHGAVARPHAGLQAAVARYGGVSEPPNLDRAGT